MGLFSYGKEIAFEKIELIPFVYVKSGMEILNKAESDVLLVPVQLHNHWNMLKNVRVRHKFMYFTKKRWV